MTCERHPPLTLFDLGEPDPAVKARRVPTSTPARRRPAQRHLPVFVDADERELAELEEFADAHRPLTRGECLEEARPCPWVSCKWHLLNTRFEEFAAAVELLDDATMADVAQPGDLDRREEVVSRATMVVGSPPPSAVVPPESVKLVELTTRLGDAWPTCALDVADRIRDSGQQLIQEDTADLLAITREGVRQIQMRAAGFFAADEGVREYLDGMVSAEAVDAARERAIDWYGDL